MGNSSIIRLRAGIILIEDNKLALIERHRGEKHYFVFPGGGVDEGESHEQAAIREAEEELGIAVAIKRKIAKVVYSESAQHYFLVEKLGGEFGTGAGEEFGEYDPAHGKYNPLWLPIADVSKYNVLPKALAGFVVRCAAEGWQNEAVTLFEELKT